MSKTEIERTTTGLIEHQFKMLEEVADEDAMPLEKKVALASKLVGGIRGIAALNLSHMRESAKLPDIARKHEHMRLTSGGEPEPAEE